MTVEEEEQAKLSALQDNIARNGTQSYYYAHKVRNTGEAPAPLPVHEVLEVAALAPTEVTEAIFTYQFLDDDKTIKVYIPLEGVAEATTDSSIQCSFQAKSMEVCIRDYKPQRVLKLAVKELGGEIKPEDCSFKRLPNKVVITLKKADSLRWTKLSAK